MTESFDDVDAQTTVGDALVGVGGGLHRAAAAARGSIAAALFGAAPTAVPIDERYEVRARLGQGGQGEVWSAFDRRLAREVAIKTHRVEHDEARVWTAAWLKREAQLLGRVAHPNVVAVFDVGLAPSSAFGRDDDAWVIYLVLELVRGTNLHDWATANRRDPTRLGRLLVDVARGLSAVHDAGLVHCDVKPGNILVGRDGVAKLGDFGLAHAQRERLRRGVDVGTVDGTAETRPGSAQTPFGGTPHYMPPEQFAGGRLDGRADQYALAATWFHVVFGMLPHHATTRAALLEAKRAGAPPRPSSALPRRVYAALARAMAPDPADRFPNVAAFADAMTSRPRHRRAMTIALLAGAVGTPVIATGMRVEPGCEPDVLVEPAAIAIELPAGASTYELQLADRIETLAQAHAISRAAVRRDVCGARAVDRQALTCIGALDDLVAALADPRGLRGQRGLEQTLSLVAAAPPPEVCAAQGEERPLVRDPDVNQMLRALEQARALVLEVHDAIADGDPQRAVDLAATELDPAVSFVFRGELDLALGHALQQLSRHEEARDVLVGVWERAIERDTAIDAVRAAAALAYLTDAVGGDPQAADVWVGRGRAQLARFGAAPLFEADLAAVAGALAFTRGDLDAAHRELSHAVALLAADGTKAQARWVIEENLALVELQRGALEQAAARLDEVVAWREANLAPDHPELARALTNASFPAASLGDLARAEQLLRRALAIVDVDDPQSELEVAKISAALAGLASAAGNTDAALDHLARVEGIWLRAFPPNHPDLARVTFMRIDALLAAERFAEADAVAHAARDRIAAITRAGSDQAIDLELVLARLDGLRGRPQDALRRYRSVLADAEERGLREAQRGTWCVQAAAVAGSAGQLDDVEWWLECIEREIATGRSPPELSQAAAEIRRALEATRHELGDVTARRAGG